MKAILNSMILMFFVYNFTHAQGYKSFKVTDNGDTINIVDANNLKQGKWKVYVPALRVDPAYEEEGVFKDNKKEGIWRKFDMYGLLFAIEKYKWGMKDGIQTYLSNGLPEHEESWKAVDPSKKYDTVDVYDPYDQFNIIKKVVKVEGYSLEHGLWKYYDTETGRLVKTVNYFLGTETPLGNPKLQQQQPTDTTPKKKVVPKAVLDFEKSNKGKKKVTVRDGATGGK